MFDNKRYIGLRCALCAGYDAYTVAAECVEQFTGYTGGMLHILTYNRHRGEIGLGAYVVERTRRKFGGKLFTQYADRLLGLLQI